MRCDKAFKGQNVIMKYIASSGMFESACCFQTDRKLGYELMYNCCPEIMNKLYVYLYPHGQELIKVMVANCHLHESHDLICYGWHSQGYHQLHV